jgi:hypothetical protein
LDDTQIKPRVLQMTDNKEIGRLHRRLSAVSYVIEKHGQPITVQMLAKLAVTGGGPVFRKAGKFPLYAEADLDAWALGRLSAPMRSTAELPREQRRPKAGRLQREAA